MPGPDLRRDPTALLRALGTLEESRVVHLAEMDGFAARRRLEKAAGRRSPRPSDTATLHSPRWPSSAPPSRPGLIAAVANRHSALQRIPPPDETLALDIQIRQLADLHARLECCGSSYLETLGRLDRSAAEELAEFVQGLDGLIRPGYSPVNLYLMPSLRFAKLLTYATEASTAVDVARCGRRLRPDRHRAEPHLVLSRILAQLTTRRRTHKTPARAGVVYAMNTAALGPRMCTAA
ncbi:hypothetical protein [Streptomyces sviceus]|uniref:hypothetical protein n=1 Tax=Streptomyces sviceus TaxID=285530 RepID=UPI0036E53A85